MLLHSAHTLQNSLSDIFKRTLDALSTCAGECRLCPRECGVDRYGNNTGYCGINSMRISAANLHFGEEPPVSGSGGSGTVFFSGCSLKCAFCQNYPISHFLYGKDKSAGELANEFISLQEKGAHNINLVTPTHISFLAFEAVREARARGLRIPLVYNTSGYEREEIIGHILPVTDIFLFDVKYADNTLSSRFSGAEDYVENNRASLERILKSGKKNRFAGGILREGIIVRHLVLPSCIDNTIDVLNYLSGFKKQIYLSLMFQYFPANKAAEMPDIARKVSREEYGKVLKHFESLKFSKGWVQEL